MFHLQLKFSNVTDKCRLLVNAAPIPALSARFVPVDAPWTRICQTKSEETLRQARGGNIANRCAAESDHVSREAVDIQLTTLVKVESGLDICRSAGFQTEAEIRQSGGSPSFSPSERAI